MVKAERLLLFNLELIITEEIRVNNNEYIIRKKTSMAESPISWRRALFVDQKTCCES